MTYFHEGISKTKGDVTAISAMQASMMIELLKKIIEALDNIYHAIRHENINKE